jgi:hypothetical protein
MSKHRGSHADRLDRNDESRNYATHHREEWSVDEHEFLMDWDRSDEELAIIAECLGRTIEACRERYYKAKRGLVHGVSVKVTTTSTTTEVQYLGVHDDDDQWWSSDYYTKEK